MKYSLVFLGNRNRRQILEEVSSKITLPSINYEVIFLTNKPYEKENLSNDFRHTNFRTIIYNESSNSNQMFESLVHKENLGTVVLFKESAKKFDMKDVNKMIEKNNRGAKIVVSRQNKNETIFLKTWNGVKNFFTKIFFGVNLYPGEADIIILDNILVSTLNEMTGKSALLTKVNGWAGVDPQTVTIMKQERVKTKKSKRCFLFPLIWAAIFLAMIVGTILFAVFNVDLKFLGWFAYSILEIGVLGIFIYLLSRAIFKYHFGEIAFTTEAEVVQIIDNFDE